MRQAFNLCHAITFPSAVCNNYTAERGEKI